MGIRQNIKQMNVPDAKNNFRFDIERRIGFLLQDL
jgi:hypothetical protein